MEEKKLWNCRFEKNTKIPKCDFRNNSALLYMHTTSIFDLKVSFQRQFEGKPVSLGTEKFLPYHTFILLTLRSQIEGYARFLIFRKFFILPTVIWPSPFINIQENFKPFCFFTYRNEIFSILPAVIRAYHLLNLDKNSSLPLY